MVSFILDLLTTFEALLKFCSYRICGLLIFILFVINYSLINAQPNINTLDTTILQIEGETINKPTGYKYSQYYNDSVAVKKLLDSMVGLNCKYDSLPARKDRLITFPQSDNKEFKRNRVRFAGLTVFICILLLLFSIKKRTFADIYKKESIAAIRPYYFQKWIDETINVLNFYNVFSKILSLLLSCAVFYLLIIRFNLPYNIQQNLLLFYVVLVILTITFIKYTFAYILSSFFNMQDYFAIHYTIKQLNDNLFFIPIGLVLLINYFYYTHFIASNLTILLIFLLGLKELISLIQMCYLGFFKKSEKKLFLMLYVCSLEIFPFLIFLRFVALAYP